MNWSKIKSAILVTVRSFANISSPISWVGMFFLIIMVGGQFYEVILRYIFGKPTGIMDEVVSLLMVGIVVTGIGYTLKRNIHVKVTILTDYFPQRIQDWLTVVMSAISLFFCAMAVYYLYKTTFYSYNFNIRSLSPLSTSVYIPQAALCIGFIILAWELVREIFAIGRSLYSSRHKSKKGMDTPKKSEGGTNTI